MAYYLFHYFDPYFDHTALKPRRKLHGASDLRNLGYVQNVTPGQVLAEFIDMEKATTMGEMVEHDQAFILENPVFPAGMGTEVAERDGKPVLLAAKNGYVFYLEGRIVVKGLLNVRGDVSFRTGNIDFVGNVHVYGGVQMGFWVRCGANLLIDAGLEGAEAFAGQNIAVRQGARDCPNAPCVLLARGNISIGFTNNATLRAKNHIQVQGSALHSALYAGNTVLVKQHFNGGTCMAVGSILIQGDLGHASMIPTKVTLGLNPFVYTALQRAQARVFALGEDLERFQGSGKGVDLNIEARTARKRKKLALFRKQEEFLKNLFYEDQCNLTAPVLTVLGTVHPGVVIRIASHVFTVQESLSHCKFQVDEQNPCQRLLVLPLSHDQNPHNASGQGIQPVLSTVHV